MLSTVIWILIALFLGSPVASAVIGVAWLLVVVIISSLGNMLSSEALVWVRIVAAVLLVTGWIAVMILSTNALFPLITRWLGV